MWIILFECFLLSSYCMTFELGVFVEGLWPVPVAVHQVQQLEQEGSVFRSLRGHSSGVSAGNSGILWGVCTIYSVDSKIILRKIKLIKDLMLVLDQINATGGPYMPKQSYTK